MHARRYFYKALESDERGMGPALHLIARLYRVERSGADGGGAAGAAAKSVCRHREASARLRAGAEERGTAEEPVGSGSALCAEPVGGADAIPGGRGVLAEKPTRWRGTYRAGSRRNATKGEGYLHGNGYVVTWAIGHLAALAQPHEIRPEWKAWRRDLLPMLPDDLAAGRLRKNQRPVRNGAEDSDFAARGPRHLRDGRGTRRRADLPLHL
jgi:hypothetical protein